MVRKFFKAPRDRVSRWIVVVTKYFKALGVMRGQHRLYEMRHRMLVKISGNIANSKALISARAVNARARRHESNGALVTLTKLLVPIKNLAHIWVWLVTERV